MNEKQTTETQTSAPKAVSGDRPTAVTPTRADGVAAPVAPKIGTIVTAPGPLGRYHLIRELGRGGMGAVFLALDTQLERHVALKVPTFPAEDTGVALDRFFREAKAAATLQHPNICAVYDFGEIDGTYYLTMAFIEGRTLAEMIRGRAAAITPAWVAALVATLAAALEAAHQKGVIHRDLKPSNIMITPHGEPIIMDFGLARRAGQDVTLTETGAILGTPAYMAPEQAMGEHAKLGPRSDVYSLGVILYELLSGRRPFDGDALTLVCKLVSEIPAPPSAYNPDVDRRLEAICLKAMARQPEGRYPSMAALAADLNHYLTGGARPGSDTRAQAGSPAHDTRVDAGGGGPAGSVPPGVGRGRMVTWAVLAGGALVLVLAAILSFGPGRRAESPDPGPVPEPRAETRPADPEPAPVDFSQGYVWATDALKAGTVRPPAFLDEPLFVATFEKPHPDFKARTANDRWEFRYVNDTYAFVAPGRERYHRIPIRDAELKQRGLPPEQACAVVARVAAGEGRWGLSVAESKDGSIRKYLELGSDRRLYTNVDDGGVKSVKIFPGSVLADDAIRQPGEPNELLVMIRGRIVEVYVNGVARCQPLVLDQPVSSPRWGLFAHALGSPVEVRFQRVTLWSARDIPPPQHRGAVPPRAK